MANGFSTFEINPELEQAERRRNQPLDHDLGPMSNWSATHSILG
jgi:hypothetical protein